MLIRSHHRPQEAELGIRSAWESRLDGAVNKRDLSTEKREIWKPKTW
jgi:hypothetical protein